MSDNPDSASDAAFRKYYNENDIFLSLEGILKLISIIGSIASSVLFLGGGSCVGAPGVVTSAATVSLAVAASVAVLYAGVALGLSALAPQPWLYADIIISSVAGVLLLLTGVLSLTICKLSTTLDYIHGPLSVAIAATLTGSAAATYIRAMRQWDAAFPSASVPAPPLVHEHDV